MQMNIANIPLHCLDNLNVTSLEDGNLDCGIYHNYERECWCPLASANPNCQLSEAFGDYVTFALCNNEDSDAFYITMNVVYTLWAVYMCIGLALTADGFIIPALTRLSDILNLSETVAGVTLVAFGNGAPDIFEAIASFGATDVKMAKLAVGALLGAGMVVMLLVAGICMILSPFDPANWPLTRDIVTYLWTLFWILRCFYRGKIELSDGIGFLVYYCTYVVVVVVWAKCGPNSKVENESNSLTINDLHMGKEHPPSSIASSVDHRLRTDTVTSGMATLNPIAKNRARALTNVSQFDHHGSHKEFVGPKVEHAGPKTWKDEIIAALIPWDPEEFQESSNKIFIFVMSPVYFLCKITCPVVAEEAQASWNYPLTIIQCMASPFAFYLLLHQVGEEPFGSDEYGEGGFPRYAVALIFSGVLALVTIIFGSLDKPPVFYSMYLILGILGPMLWIMSFANEMVAVITTLGIFWKIDSLIMGLTFLAWANSTNDMFANTSLAKIGKPRTAVAACYGSPLMYLLLGIGLGCTIAILTDENKTNGIPLELGALEMCLVCSLSGMMVSLLFILPIVKFKAGRYLGFYKIIFYFVALGLCLFSAFQ